MELRWRLFARDVLSLLPDDAGEFHFGRPPRPVRGLRLLGVVVHRGVGSAAGKKRARGASGGDGTGTEGEFGLLGIDDGTGVVQVRLPLRLWNGVALWDQLDIVGTPETTQSLLASTKADVTGIQADGCYVEADPNVAILRALECINLYKACYFSLAWSPEAIALPPLLPDPQTSGQAHGAASGREFVRGGIGSGLGRDADVASHDHDYGQSGKGTADGKLDSDPSLEAQLLGLIGSMGGGTIEQLVSKLGLPLGHAGVESALAQMQLDGAIYLAGDYYMPL